MNKWLNQFLKKPDISDKPDKPDKSDRFGFNMNMSDLSDSPLSFLEENLGNISKTEPDISDRFDSNVNMSDLSGSPLGLCNRIVSPSGEYDYEERLAIAEIDGKQSPLQAHRISYLDAFISILSTLAEDDSHQDWLTQKIQTALAILEAKNFRVLN
ncbi:MAG: hypothetical protein BGO67_11615 [Alphaproteobacteria bacterium 41-28]|nr:MAG: hypothetical protein BGO67_11615 [Alphaproteobacteria bacterium 41-28]